MSSKRKKKKKNTFLKVLLGLFLAAAIFAVGGLVAFYVIFDFDNIPSAKEAELTLRTVDPESGEPITTFAPVKIVFEA